MFDFNGMDKEQLLYALMIVIYKLYPDCTFSEMLSYVSTCWSECEHDFSNLETVFRVQLSVPYSDEEIPF